MSIPSWSPEAKKRAKEENLALVKFQIQARHVKNHPIGGLMTAGSLTMDPTAARCLMLVMNHQQAPRALTTGERTTLETLRRMMLEILKGETTPKELQEHPETTEDGRKRTTLVLAVEATASDPTGRPGERR